MMDLNGMVNLQVNEIKKLNNDLICVRANNENLQQKKSKSIEPVNINNINDITFISESYFIDKLTKMNLNVTEDTFELEPEIILGEVYSYEWPSNKFICQSNQLAYGLLMLIFSKWVKYINGVKFHRVVILCTKSSLDRKISDIEILFTYCPGIILLFDYNIKKIVRSCCDHTQSYFFKFIESKCS